jgi:hypothetical protein
MADDNVLALYPLKPCTSRALRVGLLVAAAFGGVALVHVLVSEAEGLLWLQIGLSALMLGFPVAYWIKTNRPQAGGGDIELYADRLVVPTDRGDVCLELTGLELRQTKRSVGLAIGSIPVSTDLETGRSVELRSQGRSVGLDSEQFIDGEHLRLLVEHVQVVAAGGKPDGAPAFFARGFEE